MFSVLHVFPAHIKFWKNQKNDLNVFFFKMENNQKYLINKKSKLKGKILLFWTLYERSDFLTEACVQMRLLCI